MDKIKLGTLVVAFSYTVYHINTYGWNIGNSAILGFLLFCIAADFYQMSRKKNDDKYRNKQRKKR